jgi:purine-cytosine permease-like protein
MNLPTLKTQPEQSWYTLTAIQAGGALCLPVLIVGYILAHQYGWRTALLALFVGNLILCIAALPLVIMATRTRLSTLALAELLLGKIGATIGTISLLIPLVGWTALQCALMGRSLQVLLLHTRLGSALSISPEISLVLATCLAGLLITIACRRGIQSISTLTKLSIPLSVTLALYAAWHALSTSCAALAAKLPALPLILSAIDTSLYPGLFISLASAIALVIATSASAVVDLPTYYRSAQSVRTGIISIILVFLLVVPGIEGIGLLVGACSATTDFLDALCAGSNACTPVLVNILLAVTGLVTTASTLFSAATACTVLAPRLTYLQARVLMGTCSTTLALMPLAHAYETALIWLSLTTVSMGTLVLGMLLVRQKTLARPRSWTFLVIWIGGCLAGVASMTGLFSPTGHPLVDVVMITSLALIIALRFSKRNLPKKLPA